jgi:hypothetical protein
MLKNITALAISAFFAGGALAAAVNVAPAGTASQSSTAFGGIASHAIDGNTNGNHSAGSVTHTDVEQGWWQVQLDHLYIVSEINVFNRTDCCATRIDGFEVLLFNGASQVWSSGNIGTFVPTITGPDLSAMSFSPGSTPLAGDRVRVAKTNVNYLSLAEVQVMTVPEPEVLAMMLAGLGLVGFAIRRGEQRPGGA